MILCRWVCSRGREAIGRRGNSCFSIWFCAVIIWPLFRILSKPLEMTLLASGLYLKASIRDLSLGLLRDLWGCSLWTEHVSNTPRKDQYTLETSQRPPAYVRHNLTWATMKTEVQLTSPLTFQENTLEEHLKGPTGPRKQAILSPFPTFLLAAHTALAYL